MRDIVLFKIFYIFLFLFFWRTTIYWVNFVQGGTEKDWLLYFFLAITMFLGIVLIGKNIKHIPSKQIHFVAFAWFVLMIVVAVYNKTALSMSLKSLLWPIVFEVSYLFSKLYSKAGNYFRKYFFFLAMMGLLYMLNHLLLVNFSTSSNLVYFFILPMPFLLRVNHRKELYWLFFMMASISVLSSKRSMILAIAIFLLIWGLYNTIIRKKMVQSMFLLFMMAGIIIFSFQNVDFLSEGRLAEKMGKEDITNGRADIYDITILMIDKSSFDHKLLGNGHNAVRQDSPLEISAHNEWLEIMYDYGFIAIILYLCLWLIMLSIWYGMFKTKSRFFIPYSLMICIWAVMSMVSQLILYVSYVLYLFMFLAYVEGQRDKAMCQKIRNARNLYVYHNP